MKEITEKFDLELNYDLTRIDDPENILFFDIETTGFSAHTSSCYLIGAVFRDGDSWTLKQWFAPSLASEIEILKAFFEFTGRFNTLVHFNGDQFDIRFLTETAEQYSIAVPFRELRSFDILKAVRKHRNLFRLENYKQKTIERFLNVSREDRYNGGELISVYEQYTRSQEPALEHLLLQHNADDLRGMPGIIRILTYCDALQDEFRIRDILRNRNGTKLFLTAETDSLFPVPLDVEYSDEIRLHFEGNLIRLTSTMEHGEYRYFYPDYKQYWYLPKEDRAVHKKVAAFVDPDFREKCTPENCYSKAEGFFVPYIEGSGLPVFTDAYGSQIRKTGMEPKEEFMRKYLRAVLNTI